MLIATQVQADKRNEIPAVVHVDGTCRVQTVSAKNNSRFRALLEAFDAITGCPVLLNTSFNVKGQPIVLTPLEAISTFFSCGLDHLAMGSFLISKRAGE